MASPMALRCQPTVLACVLACFGLYQAVGIAIDPYSKVLSLPEGTETGVTMSEVKKSRKYLIASFPDLKQVAYTQLPDNVWRPLVVTPVSAPRGIAIDGPHMKLYVADQAAAKIFSYKLGVRSDGQLMTDAIQQVAVEGYVANWMATSTIGDLYFTGKAEVEPPESSYGAVYRQDAEKLERGDNSAPVEVYNRASSGNPSPKVWMPSGIAVDSFYIFWGNQEQGKTNGAVVKAGRKNIGSATPAAMVEMSTQVDEVRGMMVSGNYLFYATPEGIYSMPKESGAVLTDNTVGMVVHPPVDDTNSPPFDPKSMATDGDGTGYFTDYTAGKVYSFPAVNDNQHQITKFVDAPGVFGLGVLNLEAVCVTGSQCGGAHSSHQAGALWALLLAFVLGLSGLA